MSLRDLSKATGVDHTSLYKYHRGEAEPRRGNLAKLSVYFNEHFATLLDKTDLVGLCREIHAPNNGMKDACTKLAALPESARYKVFAVIYEEWEKYGGQRKE